MEEQRTAPAEQTGKTTHKAAAVIGSILVYTVTFLLTFYAAMWWGMRFFLYGVPIIAAVYFIFAGNFFAHSQGLSRGWLWICMNGIGGILGWVLLLVFMPILLMNGWVLFLLLAQMGIAAVVWAVVGLGLLCVKLAKRRTTVSPEPKRPAKPKGRHPGALAEKVREIASVGGILLLILAAVCLYTAGKELHQIRPADAYEDEGVRTFLPRRVFPMTVENTGTGRDKRLHPTKTVYVVEHLANDGSGYKWSLEVSSKGSGQRIVALGEPVERRVLMIPGENGYITVEPEETAESYTAGLERRFRTIVLLSGGYLVLYGAAWAGIQIVKQRKRNT